MICDPIGALRHRVTLEAPTRTDDEGGTASYAWSAVGNMFAQVRAVSGREVVVGEGTAGRVTHEVTIRFDSAVSPQMRFAIGARTLEIRAVLDVDGRQRWLKCLCEERLP